MATVIRMARHGTKKRPYYRIVVQDKRRARDGKFIELLGAYNPLVEEPVKIARDRLDYWLSVGAQLSPTLKNHLKPVLVQVKTEPVKKEGSKKPEDKQA